MNTDMAEVAKILLYNVTNSCNHKLLLVYPEFPPNRDAAF